MDKSSVVGKISVTGDLLLKTPLLIGDGAGETSDNFRDVHVLKNHDAEPFIPGTSLCGVLLDWFKSLRTPWTEKLFGDEKNLQSSIQIDDVVLKGGKVIARDGVRIDGKTGTVDGSGKYDFEVVERGESGKFQLLMTLRGAHVDQEIFDAKNYSLHEVANVFSHLMRKLRDGIQIGALTSKGFGRVVVENLTANFYDFRDKADVAAWIFREDSARKILPSPEKIPARREDFVVDANFKFNSSFIIRDYEVGASNKKNSDDDKNTPISAFTLKSRREFVIPGTSLKGILRHRAEIICDKLGVDKNFLEDLMGNSTPDKKIKSRLVVEESYVEPENFLEVAHTRTQLDRFTGGTLQGTLFTTKPAYQKNFDAPTLKIHFEIRDAEPFEAGLAIFLLRDLWLGHAAIGGEKSIGRGTLGGLSAEINFGGKTYMLGADGKIFDGDKSELEKFAAALKNRAGGVGK